MTPCDYDVLIVGGGPGGSSCAWGLRDSGLRVAILDKAEFPRHKVCAGWITPQVLETLSIDPEDYGEGRTLQPITGFQTGLIGKRTLETRYDRVVSYGIRRCEFDDYLLHRSGAELLQGESLTSHRLLPDGEGWLINESLTARMLVGAGGHFCPVARGLNPDAKKTENVVLAREVEFPLDERQKQECLVRGETPELYFAPDLGGYGWCFRKGDYLNIGLGRRGEKHLTEHLYAFITDLQRSRRIPSHIPIPFQGHAYRLHDGEMPRVVADSLLLVGDAAGLAYPESGEGIRPAVESGLLAAGIIEAAAGDYSRRQLSSYETAL
ncbi:MAG: FAD-dependent monooxygenase, partial [Planctomycetaceae bacterium]|nr:FAD-dependent monooxygenase [Planctomycetaceae bacterium]